MHEPPIGEGSLMFLPHYDVLLCFYNWTDNGKMPLNISKTEESNRSKVLKFVLLKLDTFLKKTNKNR
jgi:hypothetical protein